MTIKSKSKIKILIYIIALVIFDQLSKYWATITLKGKEDIKIIDDILHLHYLDGGNTGAAWGMFSGQIVLFIIFTIIAVLFLIKFLNNIMKMCDNNYSLKKSMIVLKYLIATLIAGALGNLIDRIIHNFVIDFIYFKLINFPVFNIADCYASVSCILIIIVCIFFIKDDDFNKIFSLKFKRNNDDK